MVALKMGDMIAGKLWCLSGRDKAGAAPTLGLSQISHLHQLPQPAARTCQVDGIAAQAFAQ